MNDRIEELHDRLTVNGFTHTREAVAVAIANAVGIKSAKYGQQINPAFDGLWQNVIEPEALSILGIDDQADVHPEWVA